MAKVLFLLPECDFDPTEAAIAWQIITNSGHSVVFATQSGKTSSADELMLTGRGLDIWGFIPLLRNFIAIGALLRANKNARAGYAQMEKSAEFQKPVTFDEVQTAEYDGLFVPGGHKAHGMRSFLESQKAQQIAACVF